jgi:hypothetical protein
MIDPVHFSCFLQHVPESWCRRERECSRVFSTAHVNDIYAYSHGRRGARRRARSARGARWSSASAAPGRFASIRRAGKLWQPRALERASLRLEVVALPSGRVVATRRRGEPQAEARGLRDGARVCKEPYLAASFSVRRRANWFCRRNDGRRGGWRAYLEGEIR